MSWFSSEPLRQSSWLNIRDSVAFIETIKKMRKNSRRQIVHTDVLDLYQSMLDKTGNEAFKKI